MKEEAPATLPTSFKPAPEQAVIATIFEEPHIHAVVAPGEDERDGFKLTYLVAEQAGGTWEVVGERFFTEDPLHHASIDGIDPEWDWLPYGAGTLPTLGFVTGKTKRELERCEFAYHQGSLSVPDALGQLKTACFRLLARYVSCEKNAVLGRGYDVSMFLSQDTAAFKWVDAADEEAVRAKLDVLFDFEVLNTDSENLRYVVTTPWGMVSMTDLVRYDLTDQQLPLDELAEVLDALLRIRYAHEDLVAALEREEDEEWADDADDGEDWDDEEFEELWEPDTSPNSEDDDDAASDGGWRKEVAAIRREANVRLAAYEAAMERVSSDEVTPEELSGFLNSEYSRVRAAAVSNKNLPLEDLYLYARTGDELDTRALAVQEYLSRTR